MEVDVMNHFGILKRFSDVPYFENEKSKKLMDDLHFSIRLGGIVVVTGLSGSGKTTLLDKTLKKLQEEKNIIVCRSLSTEKQAVSIPLIFSAFFSDLVKEKNIGSYMKAEKKERKLIELLNKHKKNLVLLIDDAHELNTQTLIGLKKIRELDKDTEGKITFILVGQPKLSNELNHPKNEEIGARSHMFAISSVLENKAKYCEWIIKQAVSENIKPKDILNQDAIELLGESLLTPLQVIKYLSSSLQKAYMIGVKPVTKEIVQSVLVPEINGLDAKLARNGYTNRYLCDLLNSKNNELRLFLKGQLVGSKAQEFNQEILKLGIS
ncbi:AAA family ATPase [Pigmentibacter ruber]